MGNYLPSSLNVHFHLIWFSWSTSVMVLWDWLCKSFTIVKDRVGCPYLKLFKNFLNDIFNFQIHSAIFLLSPTSSFSTCSYLHKWNRRKQFLILLLFVLKNFDISKVKTRKYARFNWFKTNQLNGPRVVWLNTNSGNNTKIIRM